MPRVLTETDVADFRERLCVAAERLFAEKGPDAVTMRQLASELGVSPMTPYRYFQDKDDILAAVGPQRVIPWGGGGGTGRGGGWRRLRPYAAPAQG